MTISQFSRSTVVGALSLATLLAVGACSTQASGSPATKSYTTAAGESVASNSEAPSKSAKAHLPAAPLAGKAEPVIRDGKRPHPTLVARSVSFTQHATFADGVSLEVNKIRHGVKSAQGPRTFSGLPTTAVMLTFVNGSKSAINLNQVVVQMTYGTPARVALAVYGNGASDFSGTVAAGKTDRATYIFSIPTNDLPAATMSADFDAVHRAASFTGSVQ